MNQQQTQQAQTSAGQRTSPARAQEANPGEIARRELVEWCERHGLPVPAERRSQPH